MTPERWQKIEALYHAAYERPEGEREAFLIDACGSDLSLRHQVASLLAETKSIAAPRAASSTPSQAIVGERFGVYDIEQLVDVGGMGAVYRARDSRLGRTVAIKVLLSAFSGDPERLSRFEREARLLAALNHPHIATLYNVEDAGGVRALVMEFVDGPTLAARIRSSGRIALSEALSIARQIAAALEAAHGKGIVHRDLKPSNVKFTPEGSVKVLDFGIGRLTAANEAGSEPVDDLVRTREGAVVGTIAYMSPEQARGQPVDRRADIWTFGAVLYEMITGSRPFGGATTSDTIAAILGNEPDWTPVPPELRRLLDACLQKDPANRLRDIGDVWLLLDSAAAPSPRPAAHRRLLVAALMAGAATLLAALGLLFYRVGARPPRDAIAFQVSPPDDSSFGIGSFGLSPDGRSLAFAARGNDGVTHIWVRSVDTVAPQRIPGTENGRNPQWSPDGRFLAFVADRSLKKVNLAGGEPLTLAEVENPNALGTSVWTGDGSTIVFGGVRSGAIRRVSGAGGQVSPLTVLNESSRDLAHGLPSVLPDGKHFLYLRLSRSTEVTGTYLGSLDAKPEAQSTTPLVKGPWGVVFGRAHSGRGYLLFLRDGTLMAQRFDVDRLALVGEPQPVASRVGSQGALGLFAASDGGVIAYRNGDNLPGGNRNQLTWLDRTGKEVGRVGDPGPYETVRISPGLSSIAVSQVTIENPDIVVFDAERGLPVRFTSGPDPDLYPLWSPDGQHMVFRVAAGGQFGFRRKRTDGAGDDEVLLESPEAKVATDWRDDFLLYHAMDPRTRNDVWLLPLASERNPVEVLRTRFNEANATISPDGRWLAYSSDETGRSEIYLSAFERTPSGQLRLGGKVPVSKDGGSLSRWRGDGRELLFTGQRGLMMSVEVTASPALRLGLAQPLFRLPEGAFQWDLTPDGGRFLTVVPAVADTNRSPITVLLNWESLVWSQSLVSSR